MDGCTDIEVVLPSNIVREANLIASDAENDLALLRVRGSVLNIAEVNIRARQGEYVATYGYPLSGALASSGIFTDGTVSALAGLGNDTRFYQISVPIQPGNSGGALVNAAGDVVGVVSSKLNAIVAAKLTGDIPQNVNFAIKASALYAFLESNDIANPVGKSQQELDTISLSAKIKDFSAKVSCQ